MDRFEMECELNMTKRKMANWKKLAVILLALFLYAVVMNIFFCNTAKADSYFSVGMGNTQFKQTELGSGYWHQAPEYGTAFFPDTTARQVYLGHQIKPWFGVEVGLHDLGRSEIYGKWTSDYNYQHGRIGVDNFDTGFTSVGMKGHSIGINLSTKFVFDWFVRYHVVRYELDLKGYFTYGSNPTSTTLEPWHCRLKSTDPMTSVGVRFGRFTIEQSRYKAKLSNGTCFSNFTEAKSVFIGYEWRF